MATYLAPLRDMQFVLHELLDCTQTFAHIPALAAADRETLDAVLLEAAKFASTVIQPLNLSGDRDGCVIAAGQVRTPSGFKAAREQFVEAGWTGLACAPEFGGQGLPVTLNNACYEMFNAANQAWLMYSGLSHSAYECLFANASPAQRLKYLPPLIAGNWTGTMCLTEAHCGSDLGMLKTRAEPLADGRYALTGTKIFISSGDHDLADNILHLVLARLPDAPAGTKGISLFVVPKMQIEPDSRVGAGNGVVAASLEHKMGIHGNATCVIHLNDAVGEMIGEPNKGLNAMFVMMNSARLGTGTQGLGIAEGAWQNARRYAFERLQSRAPGGPKAPDSAADPIIHHPDVRRMLLTQKAWTEGARAFSYWAALLIDIEMLSEDAAERERAGALLGLLTPVVKAFITDNAFESANLAVQVLGGHGYVHEWGLEQYVRDARITMIYEGTNGIQALDLLGRKVLLDGGRKLGLLDAEIASFSAAARAQDGMGEFIEPLDRLRARLHEITALIAKRAAKNPEEIGSASVAYLRLIGHLIYCWLWARMAAIALPRAAADPFYQAKLATARFYMAKLLPETEMHFITIQAGASALLADDVELI